MQTSSLNQSNTLCLHFITRMQSFAPNNSSVILITQTEPWIVPSIYIIRIILQMRHTSHSSTNCRTEVWGFRIGIRFHSPLNWSNILLQSARLCFWNWMIPSYECAWILFGSGILSQEKYMICITNGDDADDSLLCRYAVPLVNGGWDTVKFGSKCCLIE